MKKHLKLTALALALLTIGGSAVAASYQYRVYLPGYTGAPVTPAAPTPPALTYGWSSGSWDSCSCSTNTQTRGVTCIASDSTTVADSFCTDTKPATSQSCTPAVGACAAPLTYSWTVGSWNTCSCSTNTQTRPVTCLASDTTTAADSFCTDTKPSASQSCTPAAGACEPAGTLLVGNAKSYTVDAQGYLIVATTNGSGMDLTRYQDTTPVATMYQNCNPVANNAVILPTSTGHFVMACSHTVGAYTTTRTHTVGLQVFNNDLTLASTKSITGYAGPIPLIQPPYLSSVQLSGYDGYDFDTTQYTFNVDAAGTLTQTWVSNVNNMSYSQSYASTYAEGSARMASSVITGGWYSGTTYGYCNRVRSPATNTRYRYCRWRDVNANTEYKACLHTDSASDSSLQSNTASTVVKCFTMPLETMNAYDVPFIDATGTLYAMRGSSVYRITSGF